MIENGHPTREEDFDLLALGALEGGEKQAIESHVALCPSCAQKLSEARGRIALLAFAAPRVDPPPDVKARLMRRVRTDKTAAARLTSTKGIAEEAEHESGFFAGWWSAILVPVAALLLIATVLLWRQNKRMDEQLVILRATVHQQQLQIDEDLNIATLLTAQDTLVVPLAQQAGQPKGSARVVYNAKQGLLEYDGELETAPSNKSYQLWLVPTSGNPISVGVFNPATGKTAHWLVKVPQGVTPKAFAITLEPVGGVPLPTGPMVLVGPVS